MMGKTLTCIQLLMASSICLAAQESALNLMTFNIRYGTANDGANHWSLRKDMVFDVIKEQNAAVVGLQEALDFQLAEIVAAVPAYRFLGVGRDDGETQGEYSAILYRPERLTVLANGTFWLSDTPTIPGSISWGNACTRICTWAHFNDKLTSRSFYLYNTHLDHKSQPSREKAVDLILKRIDQRTVKDPVFFTGDFNADENNPAIKTIKTVSLTVQTDPAGVAQSTHLIDTFRQLHPDAQEVGTFNQFKGLCNGGKIDFLWAMENVAVLKADILHTNTNGRYPSDHFPVTATVRWY